MTDDRMLDPPPTPEELAAAEALRRALDHGEIGHATIDGDADFARALANAYAPPPISAGDHELLVQTAIRRLQPKNGSGLARVISIGFAFAAAAGVVLSLSTQRSAPPPPITATAAPLPPSGPTPPSETMPSHSTQPLFNEPFAVGSRGSARIDRIASARTNELRERRFAERGAR